MTTIAVSTASPAIVCPDWCTVPYLEHVDDLPNWEGFVIHWSAEVDGVQHSSETYPDGTPAAHELPQVHIHDRDSQMAHDDAERFARRILAAVAEARS